MTKFYDTCSLLLKVDNLFEEGHFVISSITLNELENIKTSPRKDPDVKYAARKLLHLLDNHPDLYTIWIYYPNMLTPIEEKGFEINDDLKILATAIDYEKNICPDDMIFVTNDLSLKTIANIFFGEDSIESLNDDEMDIYEGFKDITMSDEEMAYFYEHPQENTYELLINEYLIVRSASGEIVDRLCWTGEEYRHLNFDGFKSNYLGNIKPMKGDTYQMFAADSFNHNQITLVRGPAGSGKSLLSLGFLLHKLERGHINKLIIFCNPVATKNAARLGFYPGTKDEKLLDS